VHKRTIAHRELRKWAAPVESDKPWLPKLAS
jgi:hypothetical protein